MNKIPYRSDMILYFFGKRKRFSHKTRNSLTKSVVKSFDMVGLSCFFANSTMSFRWKNNTICFPKISVTDRALTINRRHRIPKTLCSFFIPTANINANNFTCVSVFCKPNPNLIALVIHKRPQLITFNGKSPFRLFFLRSLF